MKLTNSLKRGKDVFAFWFTNFIWTKSDWYDWKKVPSLSPKRLTFFYGHIGKGTSSVTEAWPLTVGGN